jgi:hypothetical protein
VAFFWDPLLHAASLSIFAVNCKTARSQSLLGLVPSPLCEVNCKTIATIHWMPTMTSRQLLRQYLIGEIEACENADEPNKKLIGLLWTALDGLDNLDFGQTDGIFAVAKNGSWGQFPARARRFQALAVGYVRLLKVMGFSIGQAECEVAARYGIEPNALRQWRKAKVLDDRFSEIISRPAVQYRYLRDLNCPPSHKGVFSEIAKAGQRFQHARAKKSLPKAKTVKKSK